ncbi:hypothetical protein EJ02DRAFT_158058 [Clathrospora elynae]|uniref:Uncharacterized protein n=1 Tax=Clathrospora elynae TaxID=706981 RepID=A0A6A5SQI1_9PLEO|nr:hypothetical protein EJ02DRAFT_158058 [Clathrospora elynae]
MEAQASDATAEDVYGKAKASRFNFKSGSKRRSKRPDSEPKDDGGEERSSKRHRSDRSERRRQEQRHHSTSTRDGAYYDPDSRHRESLYDDIDEAGAVSPGAASEDAFRESLFDALADDEGAAYWEGVYGQPVHIYPAVKPGPDGKLERMTEDEYADYVRTKMWEKSHQHIAEERAAKERARKERKEQRQHLNEDVERGQAEREDIRQRMEESLRRGEERKKAKAAEASWSIYETKWDGLKNAPHIAEETALEVRDLIPWPVVSGNAHQVSKEEIERFMHSSKVWREHSVALLKTERVRWHPDKMQQRFGQHIDVDTMKLVTAVFQVIDLLWNERR